MNFFLHSRRSLHRLTRLAALLVLMVLVPLADAGSRNTILFIDLNNATGEIAVVRTSMPAQDSQLIVVPSIERLPAGQRAEIRSVQTKLGAAQMEALDCTRDEGPHNCLDVWSDLRGLELERVRLNGNYAIGELIADIQRHVVDAGNEVYMVVISGHHSGGYFGGELARLEAVDLLTLDAVFPQMFANVRSVLLLGCDTGNQHLVREVFAPLFPSARIIIGSEDSAPTRDEARNLNFIRAVMRSEPALSRARVSGEASKIYRTLLLQSWPVAMLWNQQYYFSRGTSGGVILLPNAANVAAVQ